MCVFHILEEGLSIIKMNSIKFIWLGFENLHEMWISKCMSLGISQQNHIFGAPDVAKSMEGDNIPIYYLYTVTDT